MVTTAPAPWAPEAPQVPEASEAPVLATAAPARHESATSPFAGPMRVLELPACDVLYVSTQTTMPEMATAIKHAIDQVSAIRDGERVATIGGLILRYYGEERGTFTLEAAFQVAGDAPEIVAEHVKRLPHFRCATLLLCGGLEHFPAAYDALGRQMAEAGLTGTGECREWYFQFDGDTSPNNVIRIALGIASPEHAK